MTFATADPILKTIRKNPKTSYTAISLFSGAGGMDLGVHQAGFEILTCIEMDPNCCETLRSSFLKKSPKTKVIQADIRTIDPENLMKELGLKIGELDLLFGGPPCQAFSQIGKRESLSDERGMLLFQIARFAKVLRPKALIVEQVKGLLNAPDHTGKPGGVFEMFLGEISSLGYVPKWKVVNAAEYGVPQLRQRVITVAIPKPNGFVFPSPTHADPETEMTLFPLPPFVTAGRVLAGLPKPRRKSDGAQFADSHVDITPDGDYKRIRGVPEGGHLSAQHHLPAKQRGRLSKKDTTKFRRLSRKQPSLTLRCGEIFFHPTEDRYLTPREYMRLHGYPDDYHLKGPIRGRSGSVRELDQHRQVANSVPPPVAKAIALAILGTPNWQKYSNSTDIQ
jgi:DNA (cytosine-5)-methyltransferase 1